MDITYLSTGYNNCDDGIISRICFCFGTKNYLLSYGISNKNIKWTHLWVQNITEYEENIAILNQLINLVFYW